MFFEQVLVALREGKKARRAAWINKIYIIKEPDKRFVTFFVGERTPCFGAITEKDIWFDDWEILE